MEDSGLAANSTLTQSFGSASPVLAQSGATTSGARSSNSGRISERSSRPKLIKLPENVVVYEVRHSISGSRSGITTGETATQNDFQPDEPLNRPADLQSIPKQNMEPQVIWLPVLSGDLGRDVTITLLDNQLQESIRVTFCAATGSIEILP